MNDTPPVALDIDWLNTFDPIRHYSSTTEDHTIAIVNIQKAHETFKNIKPCTWYEVQKVHEVIYEVRVL
jgi:hypothetical protein